MPGTSAIEAMPSEDSQVLMNTCTVILSVYY